MYIYEYQVPLSSSIWAFCSLFEILSKVSSCVWKSSWISTWSCLNATFKANVQRFSMSGCMASMWGFPWGAAWDSTLHLWHSITMFYFGITQELCPQKCHGRPLPVRWEWSLCPQKWGQSLCPQRAPLAILDSLSHDTCYCPWLLVLTVLFLLAPPSLGGQVPLSSSIWAFCSLFEILSKASSCVWKSSWISTSEGRHLMSSLLSRQTCKASRCQDAWQACVDFREAQREILLFIYGIQSRCSILGSPKSSARKSVPLPVRSGWTCHSATHQTKSHSISLLDATLTSGSKDVAKVSLSASSCCTIPGRSLSSRRPHTPWGLWHRPHSAPVSAAQWPWTTCFFLRWRIGPWRTGRHTRPELCARTTKEH